MSFLFDDDICWCVDVEKCGYEDCWRNIQHRKRCAEDYDIYTAAALYGSQDCVHYKEWAAARNYYKNIYDKDN